MNRATRSTAPVSSAAWIFGRIGNEVTSGIFGLIFVSIPQRSPDYDASNGLFSPFVGRKLSAELGIGSVFFFASNSLSMLFFGSQTLNASGLNPFVIV